MGISTHGRAIAAAVTAVLLTVTSAVTGAAPAAAAKVKTVEVRMSDTTITFKGGGAVTTNGVTTLHSGRYRFHVVSTSGGHSLQLLRFRGGYTAEQAQQDFVDAFSGDVPAVQRIDDGVDFRGGASARPGRPGNMVATLHAAEFMALDGNGDSTALLNVTGQAPKQPRVQHGGIYTAFTYGWAASKNLPAAGTVKFLNQSDQPHFLVLQHVKTSTTNAQVSKFINSGGQGNPPWVRSGSADGGVVSPGHSQLLTYDLAPGKYLLACFWPDYFTGMPHVNMGMWKLVTLS